MMDFVLQMMNFMLKLMDLQRILGYHRVRNLSETHIFL